MDTLRQDTKIGLRALWRNPGYTVVALLALALGIGANTAIFSVVNALLLRPLPYGSPDRIVTVWQNNRVRGWHQDVVTPLDFLEWRNESKSFETLAAYFGSGFNVRSGNDAERVRGAEVSADFFRVLGVAPAPGRDFTTVDDRAAHGRLAILGYGLWQRRFAGDAAAIGKPITLDSETFTVVGVAPPWFSFPEKAEIWTLAKNVVPTNPFVPVDTDITQVRGMHYLYSLGRLRPDASVASARAEMETIAARQEKEHPESNADTGVEIYPLRESIVGDVRPALLIFLGAVGLVLLLACANVANMSLARAAARRREIGIRAALGASRTRLVRQCLTESVLLAVAGGGAGLLLAMWGTDLLSALGPDDLPGKGSFGIDIRVLAFTLGMSILTGLVFGLLPALQASLADPQETLRDGGRSATSGPRARRLRGALVMFEMAVALVLLTGAGLLVKSFLRLQAIDPGLNVEQALTFRLSIPDVRYARDETQVAFYDELLRLVKMLPGVTAAGITSDLPLSGSDSSLNLTIEGRPPEPAGQAPESGFHQVSPDYFRALGIPLTHGRTFDAHDVRSSAGVAVISETMAKRYWPGEDPIGRRISYGTDDKGERFWTTIVGVTADVRQMGLHRDPRPEAYVTYTQWPSRYAHLIVRSALDAESLTASVRRVAQEIDRDVPLYQVKSMREVLDGSLSVRRFNMTLLALFAGVAALLAAVGLYGVMAYMVTQRTHEIGVRMALGAGRRDVLRLIVGHGMGLTLAGVAAGLVGAMALTRVLASLLVGVSVTDPFTFAGVALMLIGVALAACLIPAARAARVEPTIALRYE